MADKPAPRAAIYARVSSDAQRDRHTIESQLHVLRPFVAAQGWQLEGVYTDDGKSAMTGKLSKRDGWAQLVRDAEARRFDTLVVSDVDRMTRTEDLLERAAILSPFQRLGIKIATPSGGEADLNTFLGQLLVTLKALTAAEDNRVRAERIKAGKARAIAEGRKPAGPTPYGLRYTRATGAWSIDKEHAAIVREIYARVIAGDSCMAIADDLHARGVPAPRHEWRRHKVWVIVRSRYPVGEWTCDKRQRLTIAVPPIIDEATWQAAQDELAAHHLRGLERTKYVYLLQGMGRCGRCGSPIAIRSASRGVHPAAYVCRARKLARRGEARCKAPILPVADVDARVWDAIAEALDNPRLAALCERRAAELAADRRGWRGDVAGYRAKLEQLVRAERRVLERMRDGRVSEEAGDAELAAIRQRRTGLTAQLDHATSAAERPDELEAAPGRWLEDLRALAAVTAPEARQRVVRRLVEPGVVFDGQVLRWFLRVAMAPAGASPVCGPD